MLKESHERISNILPTQIKLVDPKKRNTVRIMTGSKRGLTGKVKVRHILRLIYIYIMFNFYSNSIIVFSQLMEMIFMLK